MTVSGSPIVCVCGAEGCIALDDMIWLCVPCAEILEEEFRKSGFASSSEGASAPVSSPTPPVSETGAINSRLDKSDDFNGLSCPMTGTGSRSTPVEKDCASISFGVTAFDPGPAGFEFPSISPFPIVASGEGRADS